jgi:hypothetical protein
MKVLQIINCKDRQMWYRDIINQTVPLIGVEENYYWSREPDGYKNIVLKSDAIIIEQEDN